MRRWFSLFFVVLGVGFVAIQFVPVERSNPLIETEMPAPPAVRTVLRQSCYDCHSHETVWPSYAWIAPVSWLVAYDVREAREELNFSTWNRLDADERRKAPEEIWEEVDEGEMPLWYYLPAHPEARLSTADREILRRWALSATAGYAD